MRVMGIDPGLTRCGIGVIEVDAGRRVQLLHVDVARTSSDLPLPQRLLEIRNALVSAIELHQPEAVAVERVFAQANLKSVMGTAQVSGIALLLAAERGLPVAMYTPTEVKTSVSGNGRADKKQVTAMVTRILKLTTAPKPADAADALASKLRTAVTKTARPSTAQTKVRR